MFETTIVRMVTWSLGFSQFPEGINWQIYLKPEELGVVMQIIVGTF